MLINATQPEELRVAITEGNLLYDLDIENISEIRRKGNIYKGKVSRIEPSLGAAFVNYGAERHGFLPFKEISPQFYPEKQNRNSRLSVSDCLKKDQEILIQVEKDEEVNSAVDKFYEDIEEAAKSLKGRDEKVETEKEKIKQDLLNQEEKDPGSIADEISETLKKI